MNKPLDLISKIICGILCILLFGVLFISVILNLIPQIINTENVEKLIVELDSETILGKETYNELYQKCIDAGLDSESINKVLELDEIKPIYGKLIGDTLEFVLYGEKNIGVTASDIISAIEKYLDNIVLEFNIVITAEERNIILEQVKIETENMVRDLSIEDISSEGLSESNLKTIQFLLGGSLEFLLWVVAAILVLMIMLCRWSIYRFAIWTGITTIITGICFVLISIGAANIISMQTSVKIGQGLLQFIQNNVLDIITKEGMIITIIGIIQVGYYSIIKNQKGC